MGLLVVTTFEEISGISEDRVVNTLAVKTQGDDHTPANLQELQDAVESFYNDVHDGWGPVNAFLSQRLVRSANGVRCQIYDITGHLDGSNHGSPIHDGTWTLGGASGAVALPSEVAAAIRLEAVGRADEPVEGPGGIRPRQRYTGRIYLGPFSVAAMVQSATSGELSTDLTNAARAAFKDLAVAIGAIPTAPAVWDLGVWSRADATIRTAAFVATDVAPDTQRRRGFTPVSITREAL